MQNQTLISWNFFVFYYVVVFLKQTQNDIFFRFWDIAIQKLASFPLVALERKAILDFICYSLSVFLTKMSIYMFLGSRNSKMQSDLLKYKQKKS